MFGFIISIENILYERGSCGLKQDYQEAVRLYPLSAEQGDPAAQYDLGHFYYTGYGVERDYEKAFYWFSRADELCQEAASRGDRDSMRIFGTWHQTGLGGLPEDLEKAKYRLERAA